MYTYNAKVVRVVDGDTIVLDIDLGFRMRCIQSIRVRFLDTPEKYSGSEAERREGIRASLYAESLLENQKIKVTVFKTLSFDRWVGDIFIIYDQEKPPKESSFAKLMVREFYEKTSSYKGEPSRYFSASRRAEDLANAGVEEYLKGVY